MRVGLDKGIARKSRRRINIVCYPSSCANALTEIIATQSRLPNTMLHEYLVVIMYMHEIV